MQEHQAERNELWGWLQEVAEEAASQARFVPGTEDHEECVQELLACALITAADLSETLKLDTGRAQVRDQAFQLARSLYAARRRRRSREREYDIGLLANLRSQDNVVATVMRQELMHRLLSALANVEPHQRLLWYRAYVMGESKLGIALEGDVTAQRVRDRLSRIRRKIRRALDEGGLTLDEIEQYLSEISRS